MEQTQTKQLKHGRPIDGKGTYRLSKRWNESFSSTYIFKFFFLIHIDIDIDLSVPFRVLALKKFSVRNVPFPLVPFRVLGITN